MFTWYRIDAKICTARAATQLEKTKTSEEDHGCSEGGRAEGGVAEDARDDGGRLFVIRALFQENMV